MHLRRLVLIALLASASARAERLWFQGDVDKCAQRAADMGDRHMQGQVRFSLMVRKDGKVYAAFVHNERGVDNRAFEGCVTNAAMLIQVSGQAVDWTWPFQLSVSPGGTDNVATVAAQTAGSVFLPGASDRIEPAELNVEAAQQTLDVLDTATQAERGLALVAVHKYSDGITQLRAALAKDPNDALALRGLAQALAESGGDLKEARALAERLSAVAGNSVVVPETMLRVCAAAKDDLCTFNAFKAARGAKDLQVRARELQEMQPLAQAAADRLNAARKNAQAQAPTAATQPPAEQQAGLATAPPPAAAVPSDECAQVKGDDQQALCEVRRCLDAGSAEYAKELSQQNGVDYAVGDWRAKAVGQGKLLVTRPIEAKQGGAARHDAIWLVKLGEQFSIAPSTAEARQITLTHNACATQTRR